MCHQEAGSDAEQIRSIYEPIVVDTAISFELRVPTIPEMRRRIEETLEHIPWLVYEQEGNVLGYAYAGSHRARAAYGWSVEFAAYVHVDARGRGVGKELYRSLAAVVRRQGYRNAYAGITLPNDGSVGLHRSLGFRSIGVFPDVGFKHGRWHSVGWWHLPLNESKQAPGPPVPLPVLRESPEWPGLLSAQGKLPSRSPDGQPNAHSPEPPEE